MSTEIPNVGREEQVQKHIEGPSHALTQYRRRKQVDSSACARHHLQALLKPVQCSKKSICLMGAGQETCGQGKTSLGSPSQ